MSSVPLPSQRAPLQARASKADPKSQRTPATRSGSEPRLSCSGVRLSLSLCVCVCVFVSTTPFRPAYDLTAKEGNRHFNLTCQTKHGGLVVCSRADSCVALGWSADATHTQCIVHTGFGKVVDCQPDLLHAYYGLCGLSFTGVSCSSSRTRGRDW